MIEEWKDVVGFPGYQVSDLGNVRSWQGNGVKRRCEPRSLRLTVSAYGYHYVILYLQRRRYGRFVHRLVLEAFVGSCPDGAECRHLNGVPTDNRRENLAWGTGLENSLDKRAHGTALRVLSEESVTRMRASFLSGSTPRGLAAVHGVSESRVRVIVRDIAGPGPDHVIRGERHGNARLTDHTVLEIRRRFAAGEKSAAIARLLGANRQTVGAVVRRESWKHI